MKWSSATVVTVVGVLVVTKASDTHTPTVLLNALVFSIMCMIFWFQSNVMLCLEFLVVCSHPLQTPLTRMVTTLENDANACSL